MRLLDWLKAVALRNYVRIFSWNAAAVAMIVYGLWPELGRDRDIWLFVAGVALFGGELVKQGTVPKRDFDAVLARVADLERALQLDPPTKQGD